MSVRVFSYGGGVQSTAALVLAATGKIDYKTFLFCNVGEDAEHPDTLAYVRQVAIPYGEASGIKVEEIYRNRRGGERDGLLQLVARTKRSIPIPVRMSNGAPGNRTCTFDFKIQVVRRWIKAVTQEWPSVRVRGTLWSEGLVAHLVMADSMPLLIMAKSGPGAWRSVKHNGVGWVTVGR